MSKLDEVVVLLPPEVKGSKDLSSSNKSSATREFSALTTLVVATPEVEGHKLTNYLEC